MSGSDGEGGDFGGEERREEKEKKKKKKKERTPEEREERRRRKEAERNAEANASLGGDGDDGEGGPSFSPQSLQEMRSPSARGDDPESPGGASMRSRAGETSDDVPVKSKKPGLIGRVVGAASGAVVGAVVGALRAVGLASKPVDLNDGYDGPLFVKPSRAKARAYARDANVMQTRAGIKVYMEDDALEHLDGDEIFAEIYQQCERKGISVTKVTKTGTCAATVEDIPMSQAEDLAHFGVKIAGRHVQCVKEELPPLDGDGDEPGGPGLERDAEAGGAHPALIRPANDRSERARRVGRRHRSVLPLVAVGRQSAWFPVRARRVHDRDVRARRSEHGATRERGAHRLRDSHAGRGDLDQRERARVTSRRLRERHDDADHHER
jgi:hypothetical protein